MSIVRFEYFVIISMQVAIFSHFHKSPRNIIDMKSKLPVEKYYEGLGSVRLTKEWTHRLHRPINVLPADRHVVNTIFLHWTLRKGNCTAEVIGGGVSGLKDSGIGHSSHVKILIHDFTSNGYTGWIHHLSYVLLTSKHHGKIGVVSVNWAAGAEPPYKQAVANARLVALEIVVFLESLKKLHSLRPEQVHLIGHGLGAHTAGYVGKVVRGIHRITALDPSGPYFQGMPPNVKLWKTDADYVEVIHADCSWGGQGSKELTGHVDFFPNGGKHQPGCDRIWNPYSVLSISRNDLVPGQIARGCSHKRAFKYYIEALTHQACAFVGHPCSSYGEYLKGKCISCGPNWDKCASLSPLSETRHNFNGSLYFMTSNRSPFCVESFEVTVGVQKTMKKCAWHSDGTGSINITIVQKGGDVTFKLNENGIWRRLRSGYRHKFVVRRSTPPVTRTPLKQIAVRWNRDWCIGKKELLLSNITLRKLTDHEDKIQTFCGKTSTVALPHNKTVIFYPCVAPPPPASSTASTKTSPALVPSTLHKLPEDEENDGEQ